MSKSILNTGSDVKSFKTFEEQLDILKSRGLHINNKNNALAILEQINYYRLSAYSLTLRKNDKFYPDVSFENIFELYLFDNDFRKIITRYSSCIEIALRTHIAYEHGKKYGPLGYMDSENFKDPVFFASFLTQLSKQISRSDDVFVEHHKRNRDSVFPIWVVVECMSFGEISKMFKNLKDEDQTLISKQYYGMHRKYIANWVHACVIARNIAAHGGRFYNRKLKSVSLRLHGKTTSKIDRESPFAVIYAMNKLQPSERLASSLRKDLDLLFKKYPFALKKHMGFPSDWKKILESS